MAQIAASMQPTLLANTWMVAHLPGTKYMALLCAAGSAGEAAFRNSLDDAFRGSQEDPMGNNPFFDHQGILGPVPSRRLSVYYVVGCTAPTVPTRRLARAGQCVSNPQVFYHARVFSNATRMTLRVRATTLDLSPMTSLKYIPRGFVPLSGCCCSSLTTIQLPPNVEEIAPSFLSDYINLPEVDMSMLGALTRLPCSFLSGCANVTSIKFPPNLRVIEGKFLAGCTSITDIDMSALVGVRKLPDRFMDGCTALSSIKFPPNIVEIGDDEQYSSYKEYGSFILRNCVSLTEVDMSHMVAVTRLPDNFMFGCTSLTSVKLPPNVEELRAVFLCGCTSLTEIDLSSMVKVTKLPYRFMVGCTSLTLTKLPPNALV